MNGSNVRDRARSRTPWELGGHGVPVGTDRSNHTGDVANTIGTCLKALAAKDNGFDVTLRRLVSGLITERGICEVSEQSILALFPRNAA